LKQIVVCAALCTFESVGRVLIVSKRFLSRLMHSGSFRTLFRQSLVHRFKEQPNTQNKTNLLTLSIISRHKETIDTKTLKSTSENGLTRTLAPTGDGHQV